MLAVVSLALSTDNRTLIMAVASIGIALALLGLWARNQRRFGPVQALGVLGALVVIGIGAVGVLIGLGFIQVQY